MPWTPPPAEQLDVEPAVAQLRRRRTATRSPSPACRPASTGRRCCEVDRPPRAGDRPRFADHAVAHGQQHEAIGRPDRGLRRGHARRVARRGSATSAASGPSCRTRSRRPTTRRRSPTATCRTARPRTAPRSSWSPRPVQFDEEPASRGRAPEFNEHGDEILAELGPRLGHHRRPQGPRRRRLIDSDLPQNHPRHDSETGDRSMSLFDAFRYDGKRCPGRRRCHRHGCSGGRAGPGRRRRGRGDGLRRGHPAGRQGHPRQPGRAGLDRRRGRRVRRTGRRPVLVRRRRRRHARASRRSTSSATAT